MSALVPHEEQTAAEGAAADPYDGHLRVAWDLVVAGVLPELEARFPEVAVAVEATSGELTASGVERQFSVERDASAALDEGTTLTVAAEPSASNHTRVRKEKPS